MTAVEATLWTIGSVVAFVSVGSAVQALWPSVIRDRGATALLQVLVYGALLWLLRFVYFPTARAVDVLGLRSGRWVYYPIAALLGLAIQFPAGGLYDAILARWPAPAMASDFAEAFNTLPRWKQVTAGIGLLVTTPLVEEAFFRGVLFGTLRRRHGWPGVLIMTAVLFSLIHLQPQAYLPIAMVGAALAFLRVSSGSMWPSVVGHMAFNGATFYAIASGASETAQASDPVPVTEVVVGTVVTAGLLALADWFRVQDQPEMPTISEERS